MAQTKTKSNQKSVLVIEDEKSLREILGDNLRGAGFSVHEASNGYDGYTLALETEPDVILLDILLPGIDGMEVMERLREDSWGKKAQIILLTNLSTNQRILQRVMRDKPAFYLEKSGWGISEVVEKVRLLAFYSPLLQQ